VVENGVSHTIVPIVCRIAGLDVPPMLLALADEVIE
jgi:hypothetical protein